MGQEGLRERGRHERVGGACRVATLKAGEDAGFAHTQGRAGIEKE